MQVAEIVRKLESLRDPHAVAGMRRYGITPEKAYGISIPDLRAIAKEIGRNHDIAIQLWDIDTRETRILASMVEDSNEVNEQLIEVWVSNFDYWEICDQWCMNLFEKLPTAYHHAIVWSRRKEEFVRRAGFVLMARLAVSDKKSGDAQFLHFFPCIKHGAVDKRNYVKKGVSWALRQIGKRNIDLNAKAISLAKELALMESNSARWVAGDVLRELTSDSVQQRLKRKKH